jgi:hypothetical protein
MAFHSSGTQRRGAREETEHKLIDYFAAGVRLVWYVYPETREVHVYESPERCATRAAHETLDGGDVLPGFQIPLARLFREPGKSK